MANTRKYSKDQIVEASLEVIQESSIYELSARNIAKKLNCSVIPIFTYFKSMEELKEVCVNEIVKIYNLYIEEGLKNNSYKGSGLAYIKFARENKNYFKVLFMNDYKGNSITDYLAHRGFNNERINREVQNNSHLSKEDILKIRKHCWLTVHSIAVMIVTDYCEFSEEEIEEILSEEYRALEMLYGGNKDENNRG